MSIQKLSEKIVEDLIEAALSVSVTWLPDDAQAQLFSLKRQALLNKKVPDNYNEYINSDRWGLVRNTMLKMYGNMCNVCLESLPLAHELHVHHRHYKTFGNEVSEDLIVLCQRCHAFVHPKGQIAARWFDRKYTELRETFRQTILYNGIDDFPEDLSQKYSLPRKKWR